MSISINKKIIKKVSLLLSILLIIFTFTFNKPVYSAITPVIGEDWGFPGFVQPLTMSGFFNADNTTPQGQISHIGGTFNWNQLNPSEGQYNFADLDALLTTASTNNCGVFIRLKCSTVSERSKTNPKKGPYIPQWVLDKYTSPAIATWYSKGSSIEENGTGDYIRYAAFWDSRVQDEFKKFIEEFGRRGYFNNPNFRGMYLHGLSSSFGEEFHLDSAVQANAIAAGLTSSNLVQTFQDRITWWSQAAGANIGKIAWVGAGEVGVTYDLNAMDEFAMDMGLGARGGFIEHYFNTPYSVPSFGMTWNQGYVDVDWNHPIRDGRFYSDEFEETDEYPNTSGYTEAFSYDSGFFRAATLGLGNLWVNTNTLGKSTNMDNWYPYIAGKKPAQAPDAVVWLRQAEIRFRETLGGAILPHTWKNLDYLLSQRDIAGYNTVPVLKMDLPYISMKVNTDPDEFSARRTNVQGNQKKMAFFLNKDFEDSISGATDIKVMFYDDAVTTFKVNVSTASSVVASDTVTTLGDGKWKTATFPVSSSIKRGKIIDDAKMSFNIEVTGSKDLTVRYVRVVRQTAAPTPSPTPTPAILTFNPVADANVRDGSYADTNYGTGTTLMVKDGNAGFERYSYLKFDLSSLTGNITDAKLKMYVSLRDNTTPVPINVNAVRNDSWSESTFTWNNALSTNPPSTNMSTTTINATGAWFTFDVTAFVHGEVNADKLVSLMLKDISSTNNGITFNSKEGTNKPVLEVKYISSATPTPIPTPSPTATPSPTPTPDSIDNFDDGNAAGWSTRIGSGGGTIAVTATPNLATQTPKPPDGSDYSASLTFNSSTAQTFQYAFKIVSGSTWNSNGKDTIGFWIKGDTANASIANDGLKVQIREADGDRWSYNLGNVVQNGSWLHVTIPFTSFVRDGTTGDGIFELTDVNEFNFFANNSTLSATLKIQVDLIEAIKQ